MTRPVGIAAGAAILGLVAGGCSGNAESAAGSPVCVAPHKVADLPPELVEASGIARDPRTSDLFWLHNDSGNELALFGVDSAGRLRARVHVDGATNIDVEDIALSRCGDGWCFLIADIGDNRAVRPETFVYRIPLPPLPARAVASAGAAGGNPEPEVAEDTVDIDRIYRLRYPGGPRDAEALVADDANEDLLLITKGREGLVELYRVRYSELDTEDVILPERLGRLDVPIGRSTGQFVTAADLSPDGETLAVRSYTTLFLFRWSAAASFDTTAVPRTVSLLPALEAQGEGLSFDDDAASILLASEGAEGRLPQLSRMACEAGAR